MQVSVSRRQFLKISAGTVAAVAVADKVLALTALQPVIEVGNPLGEYPDRSWERVYHDQYRYDHPLPGAAPRTTRTPVVFGPLSETVWSCGSSRIMTTRPMKICTATVGRLPITRGCA